MKKLLLLMLPVCLSLAGFSQQPQPAPDTIFRHFQNPPPEARPRVWWHWMNGNITKEGISKDLHWMARTGVGGFQNFDASLMTPQIVDRRLTFMTPEWKDAFGFATRLADSLHLEMAIAGSPGWSESGGPWVKPEDGMKKLVWSELQVQGGIANLVAPAPVTTTGPFQNIPVQAGLGSESGHAPIPDFYQDIAILAYKRPDADHTMEELKPVVTSGSGHFNIKQLTDGDLATTNMLPADTVKGFAWIQFAFDKPQTIKAVTMVGGGDRGPFGLFGEFRDTRRLEVSQDGTNFQPVCFIPAGNVLEQTISIPATTGRYFRVTVRNPPPAFTFASMMGNNGQRPKAPEGTAIAELVLHTGSRIHRFEEKAAFAPADSLFDKNGMGTLDIISQNDIIDLTTKLGSDGKLNWTVPPDNWTIVRFGYSLKGIQNHPASPEATGLEVDKLDPIAVRNYFTRYLEQYKSATGGLMGRKGGLGFMVTDSWEAGAQNWTANLPKEFQQRRGYSLLTWLPVLTGQIIGSEDASERFLFDFRKTLSDLVTEYHYDALTDILKEYGMQRYTESHESGRALIADGMEVKWKAAIPMSAMWTPNERNGGDQTGYEADIRESASVAHIYGQNLAAAESLTAFGIGGKAWSYSPENLKPTADLELANGLNRFVIHTSVHQPVDDKIPGLGLGPFGQWFNRHDTWAAQAGAWTSYLSRSSYLLQQGKFVADIVYYYGEDNNITSLFGKKLPPIPEGYNYDFINSDALLKLLTANKGRLVTPSGMNYSLLVLDSNARKMPLSVLRKIHALVKAGVALAGIKPEASAGMGGDETEFKNIVKEIWASGNKKVFTGKPLKEVMHQLGIEPDFGYIKPAADTRILFVHRTLSDREVYWVNHRNDRLEEVELRFRITGRQPECWNPETGKAFKLSYRTSGNYTVITMPLQPNDAVFVVFREPATRPALELPRKQEKMLATLTGDWKVQFQKDRGAPDAVTLNELASWTDHAETGVKYFSGTATYRKGMDVPKDWLGKGSIVWLDLGEVKNIAEVKVNGRSVGVLWKKPFKVDMTPALRAGNNQLEIAVTNLWVNRLIGDAQPNVTHKLTYTTMPFYQAGSPLLPSGLLGPVRIISEK